MNRQLLTNLEFLALVETNSDQLPKYMLLPHEQQAVDSAYKSKVEDLDHIIKEKINVTGGDDWHDGAFRATDNAANIVTERVASIVPYLTAAVVEYPSLTEERITFGSRTLITQNGFTFPIDIVGFRQVYPDNVIDEETQEDVTGVSIDSPLGKAVLGKIIGQKVNYNNGDRKLTATVERINQHVVAEYFLHTAGVRLEIPED